MLLVGTVPPKNSEEVIGRYTPAKKIVKRLSVGTVPQKKLVKRLFVGTVPPKKVKRLLVGTVSPKSEEVICRNSPT